MRLFNFKTNYKRFNFYTRFYDERKERLELKKKQMANAGEMGDQDRKLIFQEQLKESWASGKQRNTFNFNYNLRIISLIGLILVLGYFIFNGIEIIEKSIYILMK